METNPQDRLELALQASNEGVWDWYLGEENIYYSERVLGFLGYSDDGRCAFHFEFDNDLDLHWNIPR